MTTLDLDSNHSQYQIRAYKPGTIQVNDQLITTSVIITPSQLITDWPPQTVDALKKNSFSLVASLKPDVLLIGTGSTHVFLNIELYGDLINQGIGVEVMSTSAACRTFNALSAENRRVAAALIVA
jgi:uncharacterized protein